MYSIKRQVFLAYFSIAETGFYVKSENYHPDVTIHSSLLNISSRIHDTFSLATLLA